MLLLLCQRKIAEILATSSYDDLAEIVVLQTGLEFHDFYLEQNGRRYNGADSNNTNVHCILRQLGGKGGFGSMLRAIGAQIEKTTNKEACRDLSGRRLRDINEEKRLKAWLEKQGEREREAEERKKKKIEKLLAVPKHEFKDDHYEEARSKLTEKVSDAVEEGFKKAEEKRNAELADSQKAAVKRKASPTGTADAKKKKKMAGLWLGADLSDSDGTSSADSSDEEPIKKKDK